MIQLELRVPTRRGEFGHERQILPRFLRYVRVNTQSDETSNTFPSTPGQLVLLEMLKQELSKLGAADVQMTKHGYVIASVPTNTPKPAWRPWPFSLTWTRLRTAPAKTSNPFFIANTMAASSGSRITLVDSRSSDITGASNRPGQRHCDRQRHHITRFGRQVGCGGSDEPGREIAPGNKAEARTNSSLLHSR